MVSAKMPNEIATAVTLTLPLITLNGMKYDEKNGTYDNTLTNNASALLWNGKVAKNAIILR